MTPLQLHLQDRRSARMAGYMKLVQMTARLPAGLGAALSRRVWSGGLRHQRSIASGVSFDREGWVKLDRMAVARGIPLQELLGGIHSPVSIVATGTSARSYDFTSLQRKERMVVAVNGATTFLKDAGVTPDLWVITDPDFAASGSHHFTNAAHTPLVVSGPAAAMLAKVLPSALTERRFSLIERVNAWYGIPALPVAELLEINMASGSPFHFPDDHSLASKVGWSHAPWLGFFSGCNVVFAALQVVTGLGANDIEIIGMDLSGQGRVYDEGQAPRPSRLEEQYEKFILPSFTVMHEALEGTNVKIRNLSPVCPLPRQLFAP